jgi:glycosyltransferase involved in cell wall biosynthesis
LGLADSVEFVTGLTDAELAARYRSADALVMLSEHEGYGVPLVEAMGQGLPVVAFGAGAVREVLGDGGVVLANKHPLHVAESVSRLLADGAEQSRLVEAGRARFAALGLGDAGDRLVEALRSVAEEPTSAR